MVGDSLAHDIEGARQLGMRAVLCPVGQPARALDVLSRADVPVVRVAARAACRSL